MENTNGKKWIIIGTLYVVEIVLIFFASSSSGILALLALVCGIIGWRTITTIQPSMFVWMPLIGWVIYFVVKYIVSCFVGLFVAPYTIGNKIASAMNNK